MRRGDARTVEAGRAQGRHADTSHRGYLERRGTTASLEDLAGHDLIGFDRDTPAICAIVERFPALDRSAYALRADSDLAQLAAIRPGFGIGMCHLLLARRDPDLVRVLADAVIVELGVWIVMHEDPKTSARCRAVLDALVEGLASPQAVAGRVPERPAMLKRGETPPDGEGEATSGLGRHAA